MRDRRWRVNENRAVGYDIVLGSGLLGRENDAIHRAALLDQPPRERVVVTDRTVWATYGAGMVDYLGTRGIDAELVILEDGEQAKEIEQVLRVVDACASRESLLRRTPILAFGGGVVLDIAGFAASIYRRGVPLVRIPTTLVAMIDAGVGVKTAVNRLGRKSLIGTYGPPAAVLVDSGFLRSLDEREMSAGFAESLKIGLVRDPMLFDLLEVEAEGLSDPARRAPLLDQLLDRSIGAMVDELAGNLWEDRLERRADFGHTFGPAIEMTALPRLSHGDSVALDMALSLAISADRDLVTVETLRRVLRAMQALGLPTYDEILTVDLLTTALKMARSHRDGLLRAPLLTSIGQVTFANDITKVDVVAALETLEYETHQ